MYRFSITALLALLFVPSLLTGTAIAASQPQTVAQLEAGKAGAERDPETEKI